MTTTRDKAITYLLQRALNIDDRADLNCDADHGPKTRAAFMDWRARSQNPKFKGFEGFHGSVWFVMEEEAFRDRPYWPGGGSGPTIGYGMDLGRNPQAVDDLRPFLTDSEADRLADVYGIHGPDAEDVAASLSDISIDIDAAEEAFLTSTRRTYWEPLVMRWPGIVREGVLGEVHTALLSMAYNRGPNNIKTAHLGPLIAAGDWRGVGMALVSMQQDHALGGVRSRRRKEGELILGQLLA